MSLNNYFNIPNNTDENKKKSGAVSSSGSINSYFNVPTKAKETPIVTQKQEQTPKTNTKEIINIDDTNKKVETAIPKQEVISQGKEDTRKEDTIWSRLGRAVLPNFLEKELGIDETQRQTTLTKAETVKMQGMEATKYIAEKNPEKIAPTEYLRRGLSFGNELDPTDYLRGYKSDVSVEDLPEPTTAPQKVAQAVGSLITMAIAQPAIEAAFVKAVSYFPKGAKVLETLSSASEANPWTIGYGLNVAKAGAEGGLFGLITENKQSVAKNVLETAGTFAAFTALAYPIQQFFKPIIQSVGKMSVENPRIKNILNDPAVNKPTVSKTVWFKNPNDETQLLKVTGNGMEFITKSGEMVEKGVYVKDIPTLTSVDIEAFKVKPSVYENLKTWVNGKIPTKSVKFKVSDTTPVGETTVPIKVNTDITSSELRLQAENLAKRSKVGDTSIGDSLAQTQTALRQFEESTKDIPIAVKDTEGNNIATISTVEYSDGKFAVSVNADVGQVAVNSNFADSKLYNSEEEAIKAGNKMVIDWANTQKKYVEPTEKEKLDIITSSINEKVPYNVKEPMPIEVTEKGKEALKNARVY